MFENWDQDATAVENGYGEQDPATVAVELVEAAAAAAGRYATVGGDQWDATRTDAATARCSPWRASGATTYTTSCTTSTT